MNVFSKSITLSFYVTLALQSQAQFNFSGGTVSGGKITGEVSAQGTAFKNVSIDGSGNFTNCTFSGCTMTAAGSNPGAAANPEAAKAPQSGPAASASAGHQTNETPKAETAKASAAAPTQASANPDASSSPTGSTKSGNDVVIGELSGLPLLPESSQNDVAAGNATDASGKKHEAFVTIPDAAKYRSEASEKVRQQNFKNQLGVREHLRNTNEYASTDRINPADLESVTKLPKPAPRPGISEPTTTYKTDWEMGMLEQNKDGTLTDKWGNRVGVSMYDEKYRQASPDQKHSGNHFIYFDKDYVVGGTVIVPAGHYKNLSSGYIFDSSGAKVGEMLSSGEIRWPEFKVDIDPERYQKAEYASQHLD